MHLKVYTFEAWHAVSAQWKVAVAFFVIIFVALSQFCPWFPFSGIGHFYCSFIILCIPLWSTPDWLLPHMGVSALIQIISVLRAQKIPWLVWLSGLSITLQSKRSLVWFLVKAHGWVAGLVPSWGCARGNQSVFLMCINVSLPLFSLPLSKN